MPNQTSALSALRAFCQRLGTALGRRQGATGMLEHLATLPLGAQSSLVLVRVQGETLLLGATAQRITLLTKQCGASGSPLVVDQAVALEEVRRL